VLGNTKFRGSSEAGEIRGSIAEFIVPDAARLVRSPTALQSGHRLERAMENSSSSSLIVRAGAVRPTRVGFLVGAELGLLAAQSALGLATLMPSRGVSAG
jgi:hypothetical protein